MKPTAILIHVNNISEGLRWYKTAFPDAKELYIKEFDFTALSINGFLIEVVKADAKVPSGKAGTVLYWEVENLTKALAFFEGIGATLYRGPMKIEHGLAMCQVEDPFGNLIGLRGPFC